MCSLYLCILLCNRAAWKDSITEWFTLYKMYLIKKNGFQISNPFAPPLTSNHGSALGMGKDKKFHNTLHNGMQLLINSNIATTRESQTKPCVKHYSQVIMSAMASQITSLAVVYSTVSLRRRSKKTSKFRDTGLCEMNSSVIGEFPAQSASNAKNVSI